MIGEKYLPIGSVCILKEATRKVMITGFLAKGDSSEKLYDYVGCIYPEGVLSSNQNLLFDHEQIEKVFALGYSDVDEKNFKNKLNKYLKEQGIGQTTQTNEVVNSQEVGNSSNQTIVSSQPEVIPTEQVQATSAASEPNSNVSPFNILPDTNN